MKYDEQASLISVIVPIYKVDQYLNRCIDSIVNQTYKNLEIILVDDGSPDQCPKICDEWAKRDSRIIVIHKKNGGLSDARNAGLKIAKGDYIGFVDSDDWIELSFYEKMLDILKKKDVDIVECGVNYVNEDFEILRLRRSPNQIYLNKNQALKELILEQNLYQTVWNKLYKHEVLKGLYFETGKYNEDDFWTYQVLDRCNSIMVINDCLYNYLQRNTSIMGNHYSIKRLDVLEARFNRLCYLQKYEDLYDLMLEYFLLNCLYHYQNSLRLLNRTEQKKAMLIINGYLNELRDIKFNYSNFKNKLWISMFKKNPYIISKIRNILKIGL